jgi:hypothetical protein
VTGANVGLSGGWKRSKTGRSTMTASLSLRIRLLCFLQEEDRHTSRFKRFWNQSAPHWTASLG